MASWKDRAEVVTESSWKKRAEQVEDRPERSLVEQLEEASLSSLAPVGGALGGFFGSPVAPPFGAVAGGSLGYTAGKNLEMMLRNQAMNEPLTREEYYQNLASAPVEGAIQEMGGQVIGKMIGAPGALGGVEKIGPKVSFQEKVLSTLSGKPVQDVQTYSADPKKITKMAGQFDYPESPSAIASAADEARAKTQLKIRQFKKTQNDIINKEVANLSDKKRFDSTPIVDNLEAHKLNYDPNGQPEAISAIDSLIKKVKSFSVNEDNVINIKQLNQIKNELQDIAEPAYLGAKEIYPGGNKVISRAAKEAASKARELLSQGSEVIKQANQKLSALHNVDDLMNKSLITPGTPESQFLAAGSGKSSRGSLDLQNLGTLLGEDIYTPAKEVSAMRSFGNPELSITSLAPNRALAAKKLIDAQQTIGKSPLGQSFNWLGNLTPGGMSGAIAPAGGSLIPPMLKQNAHPQGSLDARPKSLEGFDIEKTMSIADKALMMGGIDPLEVEMISRSEIQKSPTLNNMQKANRLNLLNKYGRVLA